jgi:hypothetical protein
MKKVGGAYGAGPIWHEFMEEALKDLPPRDFVRPPGIVTMEICAISGSKPSDVCPKRRMEIFIAGTEPDDPSRDFHQLIRICNVTGQLATEFCPESVVVEKLFEVYPEEYRDWAEEKGIEQPPNKACTLHTSPPRVAIFHPLDGEVVEGIVPVIGQVILSDFSHYIVEYGIGPDPIGWGWVSGPHMAQVENGLLTHWDTSRLDNGSYSLKVTVFDHHGNSFDARVFVIVANPTPTPTPTPTNTPIPTTIPTNTPTPTPTLTNTPIPTMIPTNTPTPTPTPTNTPIPTMTPTNTPTPIPTPTPTVVETVPVPTKTPRPTLTIAP